MGLGKLQYWLVVEPPLWKIWVSWDDHSQYMGKWKMFQTTNQNNSLTWMVEPSWGWFIPYSPMISRVRENRLLSWSNLTRMGAKQSKGKVLLELGSKCSAVQTRKPQWLAAKNHYSRTACEQGRFNEVGTNTWGIKNSRLSYIVCILKAHFRDWSDQTCLVRILRKDAQGDFCKCQKSDQQNDMYHM